MVIRSLIDVFHHNNETSLSLATGRMLFRASCYVAGCTDIGHSNTVEIFHAVDRHSPQTGKSLEDTLTILRLKQGVVIQPKIFNSSAPR